MKAKFDLIEELKNEGFELTEVDDFGNKYLKKHFEKEVEVAFYGKMISKMDVVVRYNDSYNCIKAFYYKNSTKAFKIKDHLNDKRAYNAIHETIKNNMF